MVTFPFALVVIGLARAIDAGISDIFHDTGLRISISVAVFEMQCYLGCIGKVALALFYRHPAVDTVAWLDFGFDVVLQRDCIGSSHRSYRGLQD